MAKKVSVTPLHDRVIVKADAAEEKTSGGIIIPDTAKEKPQRGTVIAAGPGKKDEHHPSATLTRLGILRSPLSFLLAPTGYRIPDTRERVRRPRNMTGT